MSHPSNGPHVGSNDWGSDFFGALNDLPPQPVTALSDLAESMASLPAFWMARQWMLRHLAIGHGATVIDAGCGTGTSLADVLATIGPTGRVLGVDPTHAFLGRARLRAAQQEAVNATFEDGDIRALPAGDGAFDAAFCEKVLIHAGPPRAALVEMMRVTRAGGIVGAVEWLPFFLISTSREDLFDAFNAIFRRAVHDYLVSGNLARHFVAAGLRHVQTEGFLAHTANLDTHPFWRAFIVNQMPTFIQLGLIDEETARAFVADIEALNARGAFSASFVVQAAVGMKAAVT